MYVLELAGEDDRFAAAEARAAASGVDVIAPGLALAEAVSSRRFRGLAFAHRASVLLGRTDATVEGARALLETAPTDREGTAAVRARDVRTTAGVDSREAERVLGDVLVERGLGIDLDDPDHELRALFSDGVCVLGWLHVESERDYGERAPTDRPFFQPGSMDSIEARAVANLARARPGTRLLDPMCGTGGLLIEAGLLGADVVGTDAQRKMVRGTRENLEHFLDGGAYLARADATALPLRDDAVDAVAFDAPYGRQSKIAGDLDDLLVGALAEAGRVADRAVVVADESRETAAQEAGWIVVDRFERRVHRSLTRHVHVLE